MSGANRTLMFIMLGTIIVKNASWQAMGLALARIENLVLPRRRLFIWPNRNGRRTFASSEVNTSPASPCNVGESGTAQLDTDSSDALRYEDDGRVDDQHD